MTTTSDSTNKLEKKSKMKFKGSYEKYRALIESLGFAGEWEEHKHFHTFRTYAGAVVNWWPSNGTVHVQGQESAAASVKEAIQKKLGSTGKTSAKPCATSQSSQSTNEPANDSDASGWSTFEIMLKVRKVS